MKKSLLALVLTLLAVLGINAQQTLTPNIQLQVPAYQQVNWQVPVDFDLQALDALLGGAPLLPTGTAPAITQGGTWVTQNTSSTTISTFVGGFQGQTLKLFCGPGDTFTSVAASSTISVLSTWTCSNSSPSLSLTLVGTVWQETARAGATGGGGSSIFSSYKFGVNTSITGSSNFIQLTATPSSILALTQTGSGSSGSPFIDTIALSVQGTDTHLLSSGTISGTSIPLCTDAAGGATTVGCPSAGTGTVTSISTTGPITGGTITNTGTIACPTCGVTGSPLSQFSPTTSAQLASILSDETGSGFVVYSANPALTGIPTAPTATLGTNTTQIATTAFVIANAGSGSSAWASLTGGTITTASTYAFGSGPTFSLAATTGFIVPTAASFVSTSTLQYGLASAAGNVHFWDGNADLISLGMTPSPPPVVNDVLLIGYSGSSLLAIDSGKTAAGGGANFLQCTPNGLVNGDYFGVSGGVCQEILSGLTPININTSGTTILLSSYRGLILKASSTSGAQTFALTDGTIAGFLGNFYFRVCNHSTVGPLTLTNNGGSYTFNSAASPYLLPEGYCADISNNSSNTGWALDVSPGLLTGGSGATLVQSQFGTTFISNVPYVAASGAVNVLTATYSPAVNASQLVPGLVLSFLPNLPNTTTTPTFNPNGLGAAFITKLGTTALAAGDLTTTAIATVQYDGTRWQLQNPQTSSASGSSGIPFGPGAGSVNVMTVTSNTGGVTNATGQMVNVITNLANTTTTPTLNVDGAGAETIKKLGSGGTLIALNASGDYGATAGAYYSTFYNNGTNWILLNPLTGTAGLNMVFDSTGNLQCLTTDSCSIGLGQAVNVISVATVNTQVINAGGRGSNVAISGGQNTNSAGSSVTGILSLNGGDNTGTGSTNGGSALFRAGGATSATGLPGVAWFAEEFLTTGTVTQWNLECETAAMTVADCGASPTNVIGIAYTTANPVMVVTYGEMFVNASAAVTLGHTVCASTTAGKVTDSGGTGACTLGTQVGIVIATSGTFNLPINATTQTATTTLPLIHMKVD